MWACHRTRDKAKITLSCHPLAPLRTDDQKILLALALIFVALLILIATRPSEFRITRSIEIAAPPSVVFAQVNDYHKWDAWSPWAKIDPACRFGFEGAAAGVGAVFTWSGNNEVGEGRQEIVESREAEVVRIRLEFTRPFAANAPIPPPNPQDNSCTLPIWRWSDLPPRSYSSCMAS